MDTIETIAAAAGEADGTDPLDEATRRALRNHPDSVQTWTRDGGFALLIGSELSLVVHPDARGRGLGRALLEVATADTDGELSAWSHGDHPAAARLAATHGFERVRELRVMRRPTADPLPPLVVPADLTVRGYRPDDADEIVRINAAAFAHHPEQGAMDAAELAERMAEPWFDPAGLLVATDGEALLGFHWTKQHSPELGEVYVVGIDPTAQGRGLGKLLTLAGLHHLADQGVHEVLLYVESDNEPAIAVYSGLGFRHDAADTHVMYRR
ncbi:MULTISPECIES: mycothiol synthase [unclassified Nocardioides]|uniref:mycothiol synthase n=1 Tax=unclassified Nocardioides TaxID=2615069 RepID=UPI0009EFB208|nr:MULTISPECIES: mycothiol synthase [unclassified Nocardioides]GAW51803.1 N-acetyltransferase GCN5 [Nocardioides sp. PD653-B2]GAW57250.1 N-acetyltransferase GCN5 [Nocardioides sp. PD653]